MRPSLAFISASLLLNFASRTTGVALALDDNDDEFSTPAAAPAPALERAPLSSSTGSSNSQQLAAEQAAAAGPADAVPTAAAPRPTVSLSQALQAHDWTYEALAAVLVVLYLATYVRGSRQNTAAAESFGQALLPVLRDNFSQVGDDGRLTVESNTEYHAWSTGRRNCLGMRVELVTQNRQDLFNFGFKYLVPPSVAQQLQQVAGGGDAAASNTADLVTVDIALPPAAPAAAALVAPAATLKPAAGGLTADVKELGLRAYEVSGLPAALQALADSKEVAEAVLSPAVRAAVVALDAAAGAGRPAPALRCLHLTDLAATAGLRTAPLSGAALHAVVELPPGADGAEAVAAFVAALLGVVDALAKPSPSGAGWSAETQALVRRHREEHAKKAGAAAAKEAEAARRAAKEAERAAAWKAAAAIPDRDKRAKAEARLRAKEKDEGSVMERKLRLLKGVRM